MGGVAEAGRLIHNQMIIFAGMLENQCHGGEARPSRAFRLKEIDAAHEVGIMGKDGHVLARHVALKARHLRWLNKNAVEPELLSKLALPLIHRCAGVTTPSRLAIPRSSSSRAIIPASIVLPTPTSSAISKRTGSSRKAMISGTNWYGLGLPRFDLMIGMGLRRSAG